MTSEEKAIRRRIPDREPDDPTRPAILDCVVGGENEPAVAMLASQRLLVIDRNLSRTALAPICVCVAYEVWSRPRLQATWMIML
jgi:hypothetical protein